MSANPRVAKITEPLDQNYQPRTRASAKLTVVIVEDHDDTREMLGVLYRTWGCRVVEARNGLEAVEVASREHPELILMDGSLPYLDGLGATLRIRQNKLLGDIKIIALNGWGGPSYTAAALAAGCDDCILKPPDFQWLEKQLNDLRSSLGSDQKSHVEFRRAPRT